MISFPHGGLIQIWRLDLEGRWHRLLVCEDQMQPYILKWEGAAECIASILIEIAEEMSELTTEMNDFNFLGIRDEKGALMGLYPKGSHPMIVRKAMHKLEQEFCRPSNHRMPLAIPRQSHPLEPITLAPAAETKSPLTHELLDPGNQNGVVEAQKPIAGALLSSDAMPEPAAHTQEKNVYPSASAPEKGEHPSTLANQRKEQQPDMRKCSDHG